MEFKNPTHEFKGGHTCRDKKWKPCWILSAPRDRPFPTGWGGEHIIAKAVRVGWINSKGERFEAWMKVERVRPIRPLLDRSAD